MPTSNVNSLRENTARLLAEQGAKLVLGPRRVERLDRVAREIATSGGTAAAVPADVMRRTDMDGLVRAERFDRLDVLVNNAVFERITCGRAAAMPSSTPLKLTSIIASHSSTLRSSRGVDSGRGKT